MKRIAIALAFTLAPVALALGQAQPDYSKVEIKVTPLGNNTYELEGQGGNITVVVGRDGVIMVDSEFAPLHDKIKAAIDKLSGGKPIKYLIDTHFHGDHTGGNAAFAKDGAIIVAHANLAKRLADGTTNGLTGAKTPPAPKEAIPTLTYTSDALMPSVGNRAVLVDHIPSAHTDGDSFVYIRDADVICTGDIVSRGERYPSIDYANGGSLEGIIQGVEQYLLMGKPWTKYVPGHGPLSNAADLQAYHDMLVKVRDAVTGEIKANKSEDQAVADKPLAKIGADLHTNQATDDAMVRMSYRSIKGVAPNPP